MEVSVATLSMIEYQTKLALKLPQGLEIRVSRVDGGTVHGGKTVEPSGLKKLIEDARDGSMRVASFTKRYAKCIGAQVHADVSIWVVGKEVEGRVAMSKLMTTAAI